MRQLHQIAVAFDQLLNTLIPGGMADETLSARAHRAREKGQPVWGWTANAIDLLFFWQDDHCYNSYLNEVNRIHQGSYYSKYLCSNADNLTESNEPLKK